MIRDDRRVFGAMMKSALPPVRAFEIGGEPAPAESRNIRGAINQLADQAAMLTEQALGEKPLHRTLRTLAERMR
jgi:hypothetical protein